MSRRFAAPWRTVRPTSIASSMSESAIPASRAFLMWYWSQVTQLAVTAAPMAINSFVRMSMATSIS